MKHGGSRPGAAPVGVLADLPPLEQAVIRLLRLWVTGERGCAAIEEHFSVSLDCDAARHAALRFGQLLRLFTANARRPAICHDIGCPCAGGDECVFARFVSLAAEGGRTDAILMATLLVRADVALGMASLAEDLGLTIVRSIPSACVTSSTSSLFSGRR